MFAERSLQVKGGSGAAVAHFDGGGDEARPLSGVNEDPSVVNYIAFDTSDAAATAFRVAAESTEEWPDELLRSLLPPRLTSWPTLSKARVGSGLAPHVHGASFLLLLAGEKKWALWSARSLLPEEVRRELPSPLLRSAASVFATLNASSTRLCTQRPGDVVVLPAGTYHATVAEAGSTASAPALGVGAQVAWPLRDRLASAKRVLRRDPHSIAAHTLRGMGFAQRGRDGDASSAVPHLRAVLRAEPSNARVATALADIVAASDRRLGAAIAAAAADALVAALRPRNGVTPSPADAAAGSAALRRLVAALVRHGDAPRARAAMKSAVLLDPASVALHAAALMGGRVAEEL